LGIFFYFQRRAGWIARKGAGGIRRDARATLERFKKFYGHSKNKRESGLFGFWLRFGSVTGRCGHALRQSLAKTQKSSLRMAIEFFKTLQPGVFVRLNTDKYAYWGKYFCAPCRPSTFDEGGWGVYPIDGLGQSAQNYTGKSDPLPNMSFKLLSTGNVAFIVVAAIFALIAVIFFVGIYVADFKDSRKKAKKRRKYEQALLQARKNKRKAAAGNELSRES
jgi:hypothetical protein